MGELVRFLRLGRPVLPLAHGFPARLPTPTLSRRRGARISPQRRSPLKRGGAGSLLGILITKIRPAVVIAVIGPGVVEAHGEIGIAGNWIVVAVGRSGEVVAVDRSRVPVPPAVIVVISGARGRRRRNTEDPQGGDGQRRRGEGAPPGAVYC